MKNKVIKIIFNDDVPQEKVDAISGLITGLLAKRDIVAIQIVGEEECEDAEVG